MKKMTSKFGALLGAALTAGLLAGGAQATTVDPANGTFGQLTRLDGSTGDLFTGMGIPTNATNIRTFTDRLATTTVRLGLSATPQFDAALPTNDGAGTFTVQPGLQPVGTSGGAVNALWNFSFYAEVEGDGSIADLDLELLYDLDPAAGTSIEDMGSINLSAIAGILNTGSDQAALMTVAGSQNLSFNFLNLNMLFPNAVEAPQVSMFDPNQGEYSFLLRANRIFSDTTQDVGINVNVAEPAPVPLPAGLPLLLAGLGVFGLIRRRGGRA